jgi:hypothetical protein
MVKRDGVDRKNFGKSTERTNNGFMKNIRKRGKKRL